MVKRASEVLEEMIVESIAIAVLVEAAEVIVMVLEGTDADSEA